MGVKVRSGFDSHSRVLRLYKYANSLAGAWEGGLIPLASHATWVVEMIDLLG